MAFICTFLIGSVLLFAGLAKSLYMQPFIGHITSMKIFPKKSNVLIALLFVEIECGLGMSMILHVFPQELVPFTFCLVLVLSVMNFWAVRSGKIEDCGCYGGLISLTPWQSLLLNIAYLIILVVGQVSAITDYKTDMWKVWVVVIVILISGYLAKKSVEYPLIDLSKLKTKRPWQDSWLENENFASGSFFVTFLNRNCADCLEWIPELKNLKTFKESPEIICIVPQDPASIDFIQSEIKSHFSSYLIDPRLFRNLVFLTPTAVLVEEGIISKKWVSTFPNVFEVIE